MSLLRVQRLSIQLPIATGWQTIVNNVELSLDRGQIHGIVGESGSGKSMTAKALMGLLPPNARQSGTIVLAEQALQQLTESQWRQWRGKRISIIFQDPLLALNPVRRVGAQLLEVLKRQLGLKGIAAQSKVRSALQRIRLENAEQVMAAYPHQLSGGMRQRIMIAMALLGEPDVLIADEPTAALDPTTRSSVLEELRRACAEYQCGVLLISHDMEMVEAFCDEVSVMYAGQILEAASAKDIRYVPRHPYTQALQKARPKLCAELPQQREISAIQGQFLTEHRELKGCVFAPRCTFATAQCVQEAPIWAEPRGPSINGRGFRCHFPLNAESMEK